MDIIKVVILIGAIVIVVAGLGMVVGAMTSWGQTAVETMLVQRDYFDVANSHIGDYGVWAFQELLSDNTGPSVLPAALGGFVLAIPGFVLLWVLWKALQGVLGG